jgi:hypothetical protein
MSFYCEISSNLVTVFSLTHPSVTPRYAARAGLWNPQASVVMVEMEERNSKHGDHAWGLISKSMACRSSLVKDIVISLRQPILSGDLLGNHPTSNPVPRVSGWICFHVICFGMNH